MGTEWEVDHVLDVVGDDVCRHILTLADGDPVSAEGVADRCGISLPTVYRRLNTMVEYDLLRERTVVDEDGTQYRQFETALDGLDVEVADGALEVELRPSGSVADRFDAFWSDLDRLTPSSEANQNQPDGGDHPSNAPGG